MAKYKIATPVPGISGALGSVMFHDGEALVEGHLTFDKDGIPVLDEHTSPIEFHHMVQSGYLIHPVDEDAAAEDEPAAEEVETDDLEPSDVDGDGTVDELPKRSASTEVWRAFAVEHGMAEADAEALTRDELVAQYTKENNS